MSQIQFSKVSKRFYSDPLWRRALRWSVGQSAPKHYHSVLTDITFTIDQGESVGLIGVNGAGKSTVLKLLVGTLKPSSGLIHVSGRMTAILELGIGLNDALNGKTNATLMLAMQGLSETDALQYIPWIERFSELGSYFEEPVRVYSSGMRMRLAFAIAVCHSPDVLVIDEALSVGDTYFQQKCADHLRLLRAGGTTLLFVSHDPGAVQSLCERVLLLHEGRVYMDGHPENILNQYNALLASRSSRATSKQALPETAFESGDGRCLIELVSMHALESTQFSEGEKTFWIGEKVEITIVGLCRASDLERIVCGILIKDRLGNAIFGTNTAHCNGDVTNPVPGQRYRFRFVCPLNLGEGGYTLTVALTGGETHLVGNYHWIDRACVFQVIRPLHIPYGIGAVHLPVTVSTHRDD